MVTTKKLVSPGFWTWFFLKCFLIFQMIQPKVLPWEGRPSLGPGECPTTWADLQGRFLLCAFSSAKNSVLGINTIMSLRQWEQIYNHLLILHCQSFLMISVMRLEANCCNWDIHLWAPKKKSTELPAIGPYVTWCCVPSHHHHYCEVSSNASWNYCGLVSLLFAKS